MKKILLICIMGILLSLSAFAEHEIIIDNINISGGTLYDTDALIFKSTNNKLWNEYNFYKGEILANDFVSRSLSSPDNIYSVHNSENIVFHNDDLIQDSSINIYNPILDNNKNQAGFYFDSYINIFKSNITAPNICYSNGTNCKQQPFKLNNFSSPITTFACFDKQGNLFSSKISCDKIDVQMKR